MVTPGSVAAPGRSPGERGSGELLARARHDGAHLGARRAPRNRALYERHGFRVVLQARRPDGGPPLWPMWRDWA